MDISDDQKPLPVETITEKLVQGTSKTVIGLGIMSVLIRGTGKKTVVTMAYVDDLLIKSDDVRLIERTMRDLSESFSITDLGAVNHFLGIKFQEGKNEFGLKLSQMSYIDQILERFRMNMACYRAVLMASEFSANSSSIHCSTEEQKSFIDHVAYRELIECLLYLSRKTHPNISHAVSVLCCAAQEPSLCRIIVR